MLSTQFITKLDKLGKTLVVADMKSKDVFLLVYDELTKAPDVPKAHKEIKEQIEGMFPSKYIAQGVNKIVTVAYKYYKMSVFTTLEQLTYDNTRQVVMLLTFIEKHYPTKVKSIRNRISRIKDINSIEYNNKVLDKVLEIKEEYKIKEVEGEYKFMPIFKMVANNLDKMPKEDKAKLLALLITDTMPTKEDTSVEPLELPTGNVIDIEVA